MSQQNKTVINYKLTQPIEKKTFGGLVTVKVEIIYLRAPVVKDFLHMTGKGNIEEFAQLVANVSGQSLDVIHQMSSHDWLKVTSIVNEYMAGRIA